MSIVGWHLGNEGPITANDWQIMLRCPPGNVVLMPSYGPSRQAITPDDGRRILDISPRCHFLLRPYLPPSMVTNNELGRYYDECKRVIDEWSPVIPEGQRHFILFNEQNMPRWAEQYEGFGAMPDDMHRFNDAFCAGYQQLKAHNPTWLFGFSPLTIGNRDAYFWSDPEGVPYYMHGPTGAQLLSSAAMYEQAAIEGPCYPALMLADEYYAHCYIHHAEDAYLSGIYGLRFRRYAYFSPKHVDVWITEGGYPSREHMTPAWTGPALLGWMDKLVANSHITWTVDGEKHPKMTLRGVALWILGDHWGSMWVENGRPRAMVDDLAKWQQDQEPADIQRLGDAMQAHVIPQNREAAFYVYGNDRGWQPISGEVDIDGQRCQAWYTPGDDMQHIVYCRIGDWGNIAHFDRAN